MVSRSSPAGACGTSRAPTAADTIGGTTGISQPPNAPSCRTSRRVNNRYGTMTAVRNPSTVPIPHRTQPMFTARLSPMYLDPTRIVADATVMNAMGGAPKNWMAIASLAMDRKLSGYCRQFRGMKTSRATSRNTASNQADVVSSAGTRTGRVAPATATIPVPITEANQFGPTIT